MQISLSVMILTKSLNIKNLKSDTTWKIYIPDTYIKFTQKNGLIKA